MQFIGKYHIDKQLCGRLIQLHQIATNHGLVQRGMLGIDGEYRVDIAKKDSYDLGIVTIPDELALIYGIPEYYQSLKGCVDQYIRQFSILRNLAPLALTESPIIQHYKPGGGYRLPHFERTNLATASRALVWMTYLNDVTDGGGTHFVSQDFTIQAQTGITLIWPPDFTHTHHGEVSPSQDKYIITGWLNFC